MAFIFCFVSLKKVRRSENEVGWSGEERGRCSDVGFCVFVRKGRGRDHTYLSLRNISLTEMQFLLDKHDASFKTVCLSRAIRLYSSLGQQQLEPGLACDHCVCTMSAANFADDQGFQ